MQSNGGEKSAAGNAVEGGYKPAVISRKEVLKMGGKWFEMWFSDKKYIVETMVKNMQADLNAGYNYFGNSISGQRKAIDEYKTEFDWQLDAFVKMDVKQVERWCYYDLKKRGAIS